MGVEKGTHGPLFSISCTLVAVNTTHNSPAGAVFDGEQGGEGDSPVNNVVVG